MPALTLDIKTPNTLAKMAKKTAKALDEVTAREEKLNKLMAKGMKTGKVSADLAKKTSTALVRLKKQIVDQSAKELAMGNKREADGKKQLSFTEKLSKHYLLVRDAVMIAWRAAKAMTLDAMEEGNKLEKMSKAMQFQVDMYSSGTDAGKQFAEIQKFAHGNVKLAKEMTDQWMKFRKASTDTVVVSNEQAASMLRVWADIRAISQSSEEASKVTDEWLSKFAEGPHIAARFLAQVKAAHKGWDKIGTGELFKNMKGPLALEDKMDVANQKMVQALAPLTKLLNDLKSSFADFMIKLSNNKMFKNFIAEIVKDIRWLIKDGLPALAGAFEKFFKFWEELGKSIVESNWFGKMLDGFKFVSDLAEKIFTKAARAIEKVSPPAQKTGMVAPKSDRQLAGITIQNLNVNGSADDAEQIGRSVRQELQLLMQAGALSKGYA